MDNLPIELHENIFFKLNNNTILNCRLVCQQWKTIIDSTESIWKEMCKREFKYSSKIARSKSKNISWLHLYWNLRCWPKVLKYDRELTTIITCEQQGFKHFLNIGNSLLTLQDDQGLLSYNMDTKEFSRIDLPGINLQECLNVVSNDYVTVYHFKYSLYIQREKISQLLVEAKKIILSDYNLYFFKDCFLFQCDLNQETLACETIYRSDKDILKIQFNNGCLYVFTSIGEILTIKNKSVITKQMMNCPEPWIWTIKHMAALDGNNFITYSRNLFYVQTDIYKYFSVSLYLDFPKISALFFYEDIVVIGSIAGQIVIYRLSKQKQASKPVFDLILQLPPKKYALSLDIYENETGPAIIVGTLNDIMIINVILR